MPRSIDYAAPGPLTTLAAVDPAALDGVGADPVEICRPVAGLVIQPEDGRYGALSGSAPGWTLPSPRHSPSLREGNGQAQRAFFGQLARDAGFTLAWQHLDPVRTVEALPGDPRPGSTPRTAPRPSGGVQGPAPDAEWPQDTVGDAEPEHRCLLLQVFTGSSTTPAT